MIVASNNNLSSSVVPQLTVSGSWQAPSGGVAGVGSRNIPVGGLLTYTTVGGSRGAKFEARLRKLERNTLSPHRSSTLGPRAPLDMQVSGPMKATLPVVGNKLQLKTLTEAGFDGSSPICQAYVSTTGTVRAVSTHAIVVSDDSVPDNGFTTTDYQSIASEFDSSIYPTDVSYFGTPTDHDNNGGHIIIYYTPSVNKLTPAGQAVSTGYVGGFFFSGDLFPAASGSGGSGCLASNQGEIFYLLAPDPTGQFGNTFSTDFVRQVTRGTVAHEFQHMINAGARYTENASTFESPWLDEGLAHFAEDAVGRVEAGFGDLQTVTVSNLQALDVDMQQAFFLQNLLRGDYYIERPDTTGPIVNSDKAEQNLASRGASWLMLRYAADWFSGNNPRTLTRALATGPDTGTTNLVNHMGVPMDTLLTRWLVTLYTDHQNITNLDPKYNYKSYTMHAALSGLSSSNHTPGEYLPVNELGDGNSVYTTGVPGSSGVYFLTSLTTGGARTITCPSVGGALSTSGRFFVVRTQ